MYNNNLIIGIICDLIAIRYLSIIAVVDSRSTPDSVFRGFRQLLLVDYVEVLEASE